MPTDDLRAVRLRAGLVAAVVEIDDLMVLAPGNALGGGPRPIVRWAVCEYVRGAELELKPDDGRTAAEVLLKACIIELVGRGIMDGDIGLS